MSLRVNLLSALCGGLISLVISAGASHWFHPAPTPAGSANTPPAAQLAPPAPESANLKRVILAPALAQGTLNLDAISNSKVEGCQIKLSVEKPKYRIGEPINLQVTFQNVNRDSVWVGIGYFAYQCDIALPHGGLSPKTQYGQGMFRKVSADSAETPLHRGEERSDGLNDLNRVYDMTLAGSYTIVVRTSVPSTADPRVWTEIMSNPVAIELN